jgi:hypothetical protein
MGEAWKPTSLIRGEAPWRSYTLRKTLSVTDDAITSRSSCIPFRGWQAVRGERVGGKPFEAGHVAFIGVASCSVFP